MFVSNVSASDIEKGIALYDQKKFIYAFPVIEKEAIKGNSEAQYYLGRMYRWGEGTNVDLKKAVYWYAKGADQGNRKAQNNLGIMYANGLGVKKDLKKAIKLYTLSAAQGTAAARFNLGTMYLEGKGINQDYFKALDLFRQAASQEHVRAMYMIGLSYHLGMGVPVDFNEAIKWYKLAALKGDVDSMWNLAAIYMPEYGSTDIQAWNEVYKWSSLALEYGDKQNAPLGLGLIYLFGFGNYESDNRKAEQYFTMAADHGRADAWYWLGYMHENGLGIPVNITKAFEYYKKGAEAGFQPAAKRLAQRDTPGKVDFIYLLKKLSSPLQ